VMPLRFVEEEEDEDRPVDQIHCNDCGRPIVVWADVVLRESDLTCNRCKQGLAPEWEY
jgi:hypothetical protein